MMFITSHLRRRWTSTPGNKNVENIVKPLTFLQIFFCAMENINERDW